MWLPVWRASTDGRDTDQGMTVGEAAVRSMINEERKRGERDPWEWEWE